MRVFWLGLLNNDIESKVAFLAGEKFEVEHFENKESLFERMEEIKGELDSSAFTVILSFHAISMAIELCRLIKAFSCEKTPLVFAACENAPLDQRETFFSIGGNGLFVGAYGCNELLSTLETYRSFENQRLALEREVQDSGKTALMAMQGSSDIGGILEFARMALGNKGLEGIAQAIFATASTFSNFTVVEISGINGEVLFALEPVDDEIKLELENLKSASRVVIRDDVLQINQTHMVVQIRGVPVSDEAMLGRISDTMSTLVEMADRFVVAVNTEDRIMQLENLRSGFMDMIGHELRTRMKVIQTFSGNLKKSPANEPLGEKHVVVLKSVHENIVKINRMINSIIDVNSVSGNKCDIFSNKEVDLQGLINNIVEKYTPIAKKKNNNTLEITHIADCKLRTNEKFLIQILCHLIDNAVKCTKDGVVSVACYQHEEPDGKMTSIHVKDTGEGIAQSHAAILLTNDFQVNNVNGKKPEGLGLYYVKLFSELLGAVIDVQCEANVGSEFILTFFEKNELSESDNSSGGAELF